MKNLSKLCAFFVLGIAFSAFCGLYSGFIPIALLAVCGIGVVFFCRKLLIWRFLVLCVVASILGAGFFSLYSSLVYKPALKYDGKTEVVIGTLEDKYRYDNGNYALSIRVNKIAEESFNVGFLMTLNANEDIDIDYGDKICVTAKMQKAVEPSGLSFFDFNTSNGCYLKGSIESEPFVEKGMSFKAPFMKLRDFLCDGVNKTVSYPQNVVLNGMLFGAKRTIPYEIERSFDRCGIRHILAVSGLHVSILSALVYFLLRLMRCPKNLQSIIMISVLFCFVAVTGFTPSAIRAGLMSTIAILGVLWNKRITSIQSISFAAMLILLVEPHSVLGLSFLLSFSASLGIILFSTKLSTDIQLKYMIKNTASLALIDGLCISFSAMVFTAPFLMFTFGKVAILSPICNILLIPLLPPLFVFGILTAAFGMVFPPIAQVFGYLAEGLVGIICDGCSLISKFKYCYIPTNFPFVKIILVFTILSFLIALIFRKKGKFYKQAVVFSLALVICCTSLYMFSFKDSIKIKVIGHGYASSIILQNKNKTVLIGCGGGYTSGQDVISYLDSVGTKKIDVFIIPSSSSNHTKGADLLLSNFPVSCITMPSDMEGSALKWVAEKNGSKIVTSDSYKYRQDSLSIETGQIQKDFVSRICIDGINIGYSKNISALQALGKDQYLNTVLIDNKFEGWYGDFSVGYGIILNDQEFCPDQNSIVPPHETKEFIIDSSKIHERRV